MERKKEGSQTNKSNSWDNNNIVIDIKLIFVKSDGVFVGSFVFGSLCCSFLQKKSKFVMKKKTTQIGFSFNLFNFTHYVTQLRTQPVLQSAQQDFILRSYFNVLTSSD